MKGQRENGFDLRQSAFQTRIMMHCYSEQVENSFLVFSTRMKHAPHSRVKLTRFCKYHLLDCLYQSSLSDVGIPDQAGTFDWE